MGRKTDRADTPAGLATAPAASCPHPLAYVAVPVALAQPLLYIVAPEWSARLQPGHRVKVPLGSRRVFGYVVQILSPEEVPPDVARMKLKAIERVDPDMPILTGEILALAKWIAHYYVAPVGLALDAAVPRQVVELPKRFDSAALIPSPATDSSAAIGTSPAGVASAAADPSAAAVASVAGVAPGSQAARVLTPDQEHALERIRAALEAGDGTTFLLQGITASGKTEVYLRAAEAALDGGRDVLFLVPEIALGTQIMRLIRERFGERAAEYHSQLKPARRRAVWWAARTGRVPMIVGARSAVFAPLGRLGLIIVDEEHEPSYKQGETPRYHGRDTALMRARLAGAVTILGSATPSLESHMNARAGKYVRLVMPSRIDQRPTARVTLVDLRSQTPEQAAPAGGHQAAPGGGHQAAPAAGHLTAPAAGHPAAAETPPEPGSFDEQEIEVRPGGERGGYEPLSPYLLERLKVILSEGDQAILFLNRRGFATSVQCHDCGFVYNCPHCNVVLTHHRSDDCLRCHYCNHVVTRVTACPECSGTHFDLRGVGTQRVEEAVRRQLPEARFLRMDFDSTRKRGALHAIVTAFERGAADILLGTQMVAKGFDFPRVTLVGVINADREMGMPDFRGQERAFQLLTQVAGRAGRGEKPGEVIFQTYMPDHHVIQAAARQEYELFWQREMLEREPLRYPPVSRLANLLFDGPDESAVIRRATAEADRLRSESGVILLGPAPMPLSRLKGQFRWHITLLSPQVKRLLDLLHQAVAHDREAAARGGVRLQIDMDPASML